jgi:Helix-turn-helix of DDE superfamily endonuclease
MHWSVVSQFKGGKFKRLIGVKRETFEKMLETLREHPKVSNHSVQGAMRGPKEKLSLEDQLLMMLMYYREYRTFLHVGASFGVSETQCWRVVRNLEERLLKSGEFSLTRKQSLVSDLAFEVVVVDVSEHPVERPKKTASSLLRQKETSHPQEPTSH